MTTESAFRREWKLALRHAWVINGFDGDGALTNEADNPSERLRRLLAKLCSEWGYVFGVEAFERLAESDFKNADDFAVAVLQADGCDPELSLQQRRKLRRLYSDFIGGSDADY